MVADAVIYHPTVDHYLKYIATTVGRDKILRTLQYFSRFYAWYLYRSNHPQSDIDPFKALMKSFGLARKVMRVGKFVEHFKLAAVSADAKGMDPVLKFCAVARQLGYAGYMVFDNLTVLDTCGIKKNPAAARLMQEAFKCWLAALSFNILGGLYSLYQLSRRAQAVDKKEGEGAVELKKIEKERSTAKLQLICDLADYPVPIAALKFADLDDGFVGLSGTVSSLIGVYNVWKRTA